MIGMRGTVRSVYLFGVEGRDGLFNDVLFKPSIPLISRRSTYQRTLVFFGGDAQNFLHLMDQNDPTVPYKDWCLEKTAEQLSRNFPKHHIVIIKPSRTAFDHVSCYDNFVAGNIVGVPKYIYRYAAIPHLEMILMKINEKIKQMSINSLYQIFIKNDALDYVRPKGKKKKEKEEQRRKFLSAWKDNLALNKYPLALIGFSKGCVVLNQFLYEFHYAKRLEPKRQDSSFIDRIMEMYWLDSANPGRENIYVTSFGVLETLVDLKIVIHNHVSHYQVEDLNRLWIGEQWMCFINTLAKLQAWQFVFIHKMETADVHAHYDVLFTFKDAIKLCKKLRSGKLSRTRVLLRPPPPLPRPPTLPPTPPPTPSQPPSLQQIAKNIILTNILGLALIKPHCNPYFALQMILRRPLYSSPKRNAPPISAVPAQMARTLQKGGRLGARSMSPDYLADSNNPIPAGRPPSANAYSVIVKTQTADIDFSRDLEAAERFRIPKYFCYGSPRLATLSESHAKRGVHIFKPERTNHVATVMPTPNLSKFQNTIFSTPEDMPLMMYEVLPGIFVPRPATVVTALAYAASHAAVQAQNASNPRAAQAQNAPTSAVQPEEGPTPIVVEARAASVDAQSQTDPWPVVTARASRWARRSQLRNEDTPYSRKGRYASNRYNLRPRI